MESFNFEETLKPVLGMIAETGTWPKRNPSVLYRLLGWLSVTILGMLTCSSAMDIFVHFKDTSSVIYALCISVAVFHAIVKHTILNINKKKIYLILEYLKEPVFTSHGDLNIYITKKMQTCSFGRRMFILSTWCTGALIIISPVFGISDRMLAAPFPVDMKDQPLYIYLLTWLMQALGTLLTSWIIPGYDGMVVYLMGIAAVQIKILREKILHSTDKVQAEVGSKDFDRIVNNKLRSCVIHHVAIVRYIVAIEDMFMYSFLIQVLISLIITVFVGFNIIITPVTSPNFGRSIFFFLAVVVELTNFCVPGNEIVLQSEKIRDACYMSDWTKCGPPVRRTLFIIMERSKRSLNLTAAKFAVLSLNSLLSVLKSSFSYFTVLNQVYNDPNTL